MSAARANDGEYSGPYRLRQVVPPSGIAAEERKLCESTLAWLASRPGRPAGLKYFEDALVSPDESVGDGPLVAVLCNFVPGEIIEAAGATPVRLCSGSVVAESVAERVVPRDICPVARASFGAVAGRLGVAARVKAVVAPAACDAKRRLGEWLSDYLPVLTLSIPSRNDHRTELAYWVSELERLARSLSGITGKSVTRARLRDAIASRGVRQDAFHELERTRADYPHVLAGSDVALVAAASFVSESGRWAEATSELAAEVRALGAARSRPDGFLPLVLTGAPVLWPAWKLYHVIEGAGASIVADTLCSATQALYDPVQVDDWSRAGMLRALALRCFSASLCPCFLQTTALTDRVLEIVRDRGARGVVAHNLRLCQLFQMQSARLRHVLRDEGIPVLTIDTEFGTEDVEQIRVRVEAFLEMIRERRSVQ